MERLNFNIWAFGQDFLDMFESWSPKKQRDFINELRGSLLNEN